MAGGRGIASAFPLHRKNQNEKWQGYNLHGFQKKGGKTMETNLAVEVVRDIFHSVPVGGKIAIGLAIVVGMAAYSVMEHGYEISFSFKPATTAN